MYTHLCIRPGCGLSYEDEDVDAYYCESCNEARKVIAQELDRKIASQPKERPLSDLQAYDAQAKTIPGPNGRTISFMKTTL